MAWEPGAQAYPQAPPDPRFAAPAPWEPDDSAFAAPTQEPQPWDTAADPEQWGGAWPFEESVQSWEPDDRSWLWPTQEVPSNTGSWEAADPSPWQEDRWGTPGQPGEPAAYQSGRWAATSGGAGPPPAAAAPHPDAAAWAAGETSGQIYGYPDSGDLPAFGGAAEGSGYSAGPVGTGPAASGPATAGAEPAYGYATPSAAPGYQGIAPQDPQGLQWSQETYEAQGVAPGGGAVAAGSQAWTGGSGSQAWADPPAQAWYGDEPPRPYDQPGPYEPSAGELTSVLEDDDEQVVRLGRAVDDPDGRRFGSVDGARAQPGRSLRTGEARRLQPTGEYRRRRSNWPRVVALISWIVLLMVVCWFYLFPWLEGILPENF
jgi:hypothetical protein